MEYRADFHRELWHFSHDCPKWPANSFNILRMDKLPIALQPCPVCQALTSTVALTNSPRLVSVAR